MAESASIRFPVDVLMPKCKAPPRTSYRADFALGDRVLIGDDDETRGKVTAICWRTEFPQIEVSWMHNGSLQCVWVPPTMLRLADGA